MSKIEVNAIEPQCGTNLTVGASGDTITFPSGTTVVNNGSQTGFGRTGTVDWDTTAKTASFTAVSGNGYFVNTTSGAITVTLPAGSAGDIISLADYTNTWQTNSVTITPNGSDKIGGVNDDAVLNTEGQSVTFVFVDSTEGWKNVQDSTSNVIGNEFIIATGGTETTCGNCKIHTFTGPGTFCVSAVHPCAANNLVSYMVVAGGGGGGGLYIGGGGGAGGFREYKSPVTPYTASPLDGNPCGTSVTVTATAFPITVGAGGVGNTCGGATDSTSGSNSVFSTITSAGGGFGKQDQTNPAISSGSPGGSGGGGNGGPDGQRPGGTGNTPPVSPPQGTNGGIGSPGNPGAAGGGGGATVAGSAAPNNTDGGAGGTGTSTSISGSSLSYAGGGGGSGRSGTPGAGSPCGTGGQGGNPAVTAVAGTTNRGGGGGGSDIDVPGNGGSGIVVIRYKYQ